MRTAVAVRSPSLPASLRRPSKAPVTLAPALCAASGQAAGDAARPLLGGAKGLGHLRVEPRGLLLEDARPRLDAGQHLFHRLVAAGEKIDEARLDGFQRASRVGERAGMSAGDLGERGPAGIERGGEVGRIAQGALGHGLQLIDLFGDASAGALRLGADGGERRLHLLDPTRQAVLDGAEIFSGIGDEFAQGRIRPLDPVQDASQFAAETIAGLVEARQRTGGAAVDGCQQGIPGRFGLFGEVPNTITQGVGEGLSALVEDTCDLLIALAQGGDELGGRPLRRSRGGARNASPSPSTIWVPRVSIVSTIDPPRSSIARVIVSALSARRRARDCPRASIREARAVERAIEAGDHVLVAPVDEGGHGLVALVQSRGERIGMGLGEGGVAVHPLVESGEHRRAALVDQGRIGVLAVVERIGESIAAGRDEGGEHLHPAVDPVREGLAAGIHGLGQGGAVVVDRMSESGRTAVHELVEGAQALVEQKLRWPAYGHRPTGSVTGPDRPPCGVNAPVRSSTRSVRARIRASKTFPMA